MRTSRAQLYLGRVTLDNPQTNRFDPFSTRAERALTRITIAIALTFVGYVALRILAAGGSL